MHQGLRFIDYPVVHEFPSEYVEVDPYSEDYQLINMPFDWEPRKAYPTHRVREVTRPNIESKLLNSPRGLMVARQRAILLAE